MRRSILVGHRVECSDGIRGVLVADIDRAIFSADFPANNWNYLRQGVLVDTDEAGLVHYSDRSQVFAIET